jgi:class 3 adenylate cyclase
VYSFGKDNTFATSLGGGQYGGTALGQVVRRAIDSGTVTLQVVDFTAFEPALDEPVAFLAAPLIDGGELVGAVAVGVTSEGISEVLTRSWREGRGWETGEVYVVGPDRRMRSDSRFFLEAPEAYVAQVEAIGNTEQIDLNRMEALNTTVLFQEVDSPAIRSALAGEDDIVEGTNYLDQDVVTAYQQLPDTLGWVVVAEVGRSELTQPAVDLTNEATVVAAVFIVLITFLAVAWSNVFVGPLRSISAALQRVSGGSPFMSVPRRGTREFRQLAASIDDMVIVLAQRTGEATRAIAHKVEILRVLLPPAAIARINEGSRKLVETSRQATVVAMSFPGINAVALSVSQQRRREIINEIIDEADALAELNGLQRIKVGAERYFAVCGTDTPYLDHAQRSVTFAFQLREEMERYAHDEGLDIGITAGIDSGSVTVGLIGDSRLVYDLWGEAVDNASLLARAGDRGQILIADSTKDRVSVEATPAGVEGVGQDVYSVEPSKVREVST